jgi:hypothetical protein
LCAESADAKESAQAVRFQYEAPAECPGVAELTARVRERTERGRPAEASELARTFVLRIARDGAGFVGSVEFLDDSGSSVDRLVRGEQCDAVVSSLALITALALDATLNEDEPDPVLAPPPAPRTLPRVAPAPSTVPPPRPRPMTPARSVAARVGAVGSYATAIDSWTYGLLGQLDWPGGLALRFVGHYASDDRVVDRGRRANLRLMGVTGSGCYWSLRGEAFSLQPCLGLDFGSLRGRGIQSDALPKAYSQTMVWAALGPELRLAWEPAPPFWLELHGNLHFPLVAYEFRFELPDRLVYEPPRVTAALGVATGVRFW